MPLMIQISQRNGCTFDVTKREIREKRHIEKSDMEKINKTSKLDETEIEAHRR